MDLSDATIGQLMILVADFERGMAFYRDVLGLPLLFSVPPQMACFMCGEVRLLVGAMQAGEAVPRSSGIYFKVDDIRGTATSLRAKGADFLTVPHLVHRTPASELWLAEFADPDGNRMALMSELPVVTMEEAIA